MIDRINLKIGRFNLEQDSAQSPACGWEGREEEEGKMRDDIFHLRDPHTIKMMKHIVKYFKTATTKAKQI